jgi:hypothetical protein
MPQHVRVQPPSLGLHLRLERQVWQVWLMRQRLVRVSPIQLCYHLQNLPTSMPVFPTVWD